MVSVDHPPRSVVTADVWLGRPAGMLVEASSRAALVVVGARSHGEVVGRFLGSVSQQLAMHARCPVSVVRGEDASRAHGPVVVGVDSSAQALVAESARVAEMVEATAGRHPDTRIELADERGHPVRVLTRYAEDAGVLVVGSRGRGGFASLVLGSVSLGVLAHASCTVTVVRSD